MTDNRIRQENGQYISAENDLSVSPKMTRNTGCWNVEEQEKYIIFLQVFKKQLQSKLQRKQHRIFKLMASLIETRDGIQCRSHHMKQLRTFKRIKKIVQNFKISNQFTEAGSHFRSILNSYVQGNFYPPADGIKQFPAEINQLKLSSSSKPHSPQITKADNNQPIFSLFGVVLPQMLIFFPQNFSFPSAPSLSGMNLNDLPDQQE